MEVPTNWVQVLWIDAAFRNGLWHPRQPRASPVRVSPDGSREAAPLEVVKFPSTRGDGGHGTDGVAVECLKAELEKGRRVPEIYRQIREGHCRVGPERESEQSADQCQGTSSEVGNRADSSRGRGTSSR